MATPEPGPPPGPATMLPTGPRERRGPSRGVLVAIVVAVLAVVGVVVGLLVSGGSSGKTATTVPAGTGVTVPRGGIVYASSGRTLTSPDDVRKDVADLLAGKLAKVSGPSPAPNPTSTPQLGTDLAYNDPQLPACLGTLAAGATLLGVDRASYSGALSLVVVVQDGAGAKKAFAYVVGPSCSTPGGSGIRTVVVVPLS